MTYHRKLRGLFGSLVLGGLLCSPFCFVPAAAQLAPGDETEAAGVDAAPVRSARLTFLAGAVEVQRSDNTAADAPVLNMPLSEGTRLVTGDYGQVEVEFEDGSVVRLTPRSSLTLDALALDAGNARTEMTLLGGMAYLELRKAAGYSYTFHAGGVTLTPVANATVRVHAEEGPSVFSVLTGVVRLERLNGFRADVHGGESLHADATDETRYFLNSEVAEESWDRWNESRDQLAADDADKRTMARDRYAGAQGYGWSDLDANGSWYDVPGQGAVWQPDAADESFDPYGYGNWVWFNAGYVWGSGYAWGWTPYRCGRWMYFPGFGWGWVPDARCAGWGAGGGVLIGGRTPVGYKTVRMPIKGPGKVHPIVPVHGVDGLRPPVLTGGVRRIGSVAVTPMPRTNAWSVRGGSSVGQALSRDFPVDARTHMPVLGVVAKERDTPVVVLGNQPAGSAAWIHVQPRTKMQDKADRSSVPAESRTSQAPNDRRNGAAGARVQPAPSAGTNAPLRTPVREPAPVQARQSAPAPAQISHPAPAPPSPSPPPPSPAPAPAPARMDTSKPKG